MKILYFDCFAGISGDMTLGALIDIGVDPEYLKNELSKLMIDQEFNLEIKKDMRKGITGTKVNVILSAEVGGHHEHGCDHGHHDDCGAHDAHGHHSHHEHGGHHDHHDHEEHVHHGHQHDGDYAHRNLADIERIINSSALSDNVKKMSLEMFMAVAEAEAKVHGKPLYEVHFHEVGAVDSIVDIVGTAIAIDYLKVDKIMASTVEIGGGFVKCAHGLMPVPAPATAEILKGIPVKMGTVYYETTTPTGAAILSANVSEFNDKLTLTIDAIGYGVGTKDAEIPNVLRVYICRDEKKNH